jgi:hypothetical protein
MFVMMAMFLAKAQDAMSILEDLSGMLENLDAPPPVLAHVQTAREETALVGLAINEVLLRELGALEGGGWADVFKDADTSMMN